MTSARFRRRRRAGLIVASAAGLSLVASSAWAAVTVGDDPNALAAAVVGAAPLTGASLAVDYPCAVACPTGVGTTPLAGFPTNGSTFAILTTGDAALADQPNDDTGSGFDWGVDGAVIGTSAHDHQIARIDLGPATGTCLAFDFRFLSEEFPEYVTSGFNDAFVAQLDTWAVTADPAAQTVSAPGDFAAGAGDVISVDASGPSAMTAAQAAGTTYDGATLPLVARKPVAQGSTHSLYLTIFDQGDGILDTAVFVDNLRYETLPAGQCKSLAVEPFEGTTGVTLVPGTAPGFTPGFAAMSIPLNCDLPPGPLTCDVSATSSFVDWGDVVPRKAARAAKATTALGAGSVSIKGGASGTLTLASTPAGAAAVKAAADQPAQLKLKAKKLAKKAKKLKKKAKKAAPAKAKKLAKKAKKIKKRAKKTKKSAASLGKQPLGTVVVTITNPANGKSDLLRIVMPR